MNFLTIYSKYKILAKKSNFRCHWFLIYGKKHHRQHLLRYFVALSSGDFSAEFRDEQLSGRFQAILCGFEYKFPAVWS